jgi:hypothetical protein
MAGHLSAAVIVSAWLTFDAPNTHRTSELGAIREQGLQWLSLATKWHAHILTAVSRRSWFFALLINGGSSLIIKFLSS